MHAFEPATVLSAVTGIVPHQDGSFVTIPDAHFLFHADFKRSGSDLVLSGEDGQRYVIPGYFKNEKLPTLLSPEGAALSGELVEALAGPLAPGQYAQAGGAPSTQEAIGRVATVQGSAVAVRNGVAVALNVGDAVYKGDVVQTQSGSALGVTFADGSTFSLNANARMVLNEFVYNPGGSQNSALINLVQGSIAFVAGEVARSGDMRVGTPVATMGIRGTAVSVEIAADNGATKFSVMVEPNGRVGSFNLYENGTGRLLGTVSNSAVGWEVTPAGPLQVLAQQFQKSPEVLARELQLVVQVFNTQAIGNDIIQRTAPQQQQQPTTDPNSKSTTGSSSYIIEHNTDKGTTEQTKVVIKTVEKIGEEKKEEAQQKESTTVVFVPPPPAPPPVNPAAFFLSGGTLIRLEGPAGGVASATSLLAPDVSADGRFVAFNSSSGIPGRGGDVFLYNRQTGVTTRITEAAETDLTYEGVSISLDGRYVVYQAHEGETQSTVFVYDRLTGASTGIHQGGNAHIDGAGNFIAMEGQAGQSNGILVTDRAGNVVTQVSGDLPVWSPEINADGRLITFTTKASQITINGHVFNVGPDGHNQIYLYDRVTDTLRMVSVSSEGEAGGGDSGILGPNGENGDWPSSISADGRYVVFQSSADNLVDGDQNTASDIFVRDLVTGTTERISTRVSHSGNYHFGDPEQTVERLNAVAAGDQKSPSVASLADGGILAVWAVQGGPGVVAQRYDVYGNEVGGEFQASTQAVAADAQPAAVGLTDGGFVIVWVSVNGIHGQRFTSGGSAAGSEFQINTDAAPDGDPAIVATADGGFFVTWTSTAASGAGADIHAQRFDSRGTALGGEARINTAAAGDQLDSSIGALSDGGFLVTWTSPSPVAGAGTTVFAQRFASNGAASGDQFQIDSSHPANNLSQSASTALVGGGYVVTWTSSGPGDTGQDVYARRYDTNGSAQAIVKVNTTAAGNQNNSTVVTLPTGGFVVFWTTDLAGGGTGIAGQRFDAFGVKLGPEFAVSPASDTTASDVQATVLPSGSVAVAWTSQDAQGSTGIFGTIYSDLVSLEANEASYRPQISPDGRYITFSSDATNLVSGDTNATADTFIYDRVTGTIERVSVGALGQQSFGPESFGDAVSGGGSVVSFGGIGIAFSPNSSVALQADGKTIKFSAEAVSDLGGSGTMTLTAQVGHGKLAGAGLAVVGTQDGSNGTLVATGTLVQLIAAVKNGLFYTPTAAGNDTLTITITDGDGGILTRTITFTPQGVVVSEETTVQPSSVFILDRSTGRSGTVLDDPAALTLVSSDLSFAQTGPETSLWVNQMRPDPTTQPAALQQVGEVFTVPAGQGELKSATFFLSSPGAAAGGSSYYQFKLYSWVNGAPEGPAIFTSAKFQIPSEGMPLTAANIALNLALEAGKQYVVEIVGDGRLGVAPAAATGAGALFTQTGTGPWTASGNLRAEFDFEPALTTAGSLPFTDVSDTHTVSVQSNGSWGSLNAWIATDTEGGNTAGLVKWAYAVDPKLAASLALGEVHTDTFAVTLRDSGGNTTTTMVTVTVAGTNERPNITSAVATRSFDELPGHMFDGTAESAHTADGTFSFTDFNFVNADLSDTHTIATTLAASQWKTAGGAALNFADFNDPALPVSLARFAATGNQQGEAGKTFTAWLTRDSTNSSDGLVTWNFTLPDDMVDFLAAGETLTLTYKVTVIDSHAATDTRTVTVTVTGQNDAPVITTASGDDVAQTLTEAAETTAAPEANAGDLTASGTLAFYDVDASDTFTARVLGVTESGTFGAASNGESPDNAEFLAMLTLPTAAAGGTAEDEGSIPWSFSGGEDRFDYLASGESVTLSYLIELRDSHGGTDTQTVSVTVTGQNDAPVITTASGDDVAQTLTEAAETTAAPEANAGNLSASGTLAFYDVDASDTFTARVLGVTESGTFGAASNGESPDNAEFLAMLTLPTAEAGGTAEDEGSIPWSFSGGEDRFDYLASGESVTLSYLIELRDNHGGTDTQTVSVTVTGQNDAPVITTASGDDVAQTLTEAAETTAAPKANAGDLTASGTLAFYDVDASDTFTARVLGVTESGTFGAASNGESPDNAEFLAMLTLPTAEAGGTAEDEGSIPWSFSGGEDRFDYLASGESVTLSYLIELRDSHGGTDTQTVSVTVTGQNDAPVITTASGDDVAQTLTEAAETTAAPEANAGDLTASGTLAFYDVDASDTFTARVLGVTESGTFGAASNGESPDNAEFLAMLTLPTAEAGGTAEDEGSIPWSFSGGEDRFDYLASGESVTLSYLIELRDSHGGTDTQTVSVTVTGQNDAPVITTASGDDVAQTLTEAAETTAAPEANAGDLTASGTLAFYDVDASDTFTARVLGVTESGTFGAASNGESPDNAEFLAMLTLPTAEAGGTAEDEGSIPWSFSGGEDRFDYLASGESVTLSYLIELRDNHGGTDTQTVSVTVTGQNDAPVITTQDLAGAVTEQGTPSGNLTDSGAITFRDVDISDVHLVSPNGTPIGTTLGTLTAIKNTDTTGTGIGGQLTWTYTVAAAAVEYLSADETRVESFTITLDDQHGGLITRQIDVTITGTDDAPAITSADPAAGLTEQGLTTGSDTADAASGTLSFTDVDLSETGHTAAVTQVAASGTTAGAPDDATLLSFLSTGTVTKTAGSSSGSIAWSFAAADRSFDYLKVGEQLVLTYTVEVTDASNATGTQTVTVTITGTDDAPVITSAAADLQGAVIEDHPPVVTGHLAATDGDAGDTQTWSVVGGSWEQADFFVTLDRFVVVKNGTTIFEDNFDDGVAPPSSPGFVNPPNPTNYGVATGATIVEVDGRAVLYGPLGAPPGPGLGTTDEFVSVNATLPTDITSGSGVGLRQNSTFVVAQRYDFYAPDDLREFYGVRLSDRVSVSGVPTGGADALELSVRRAQDGHLAVQFRDLDFVANTSPVVIGEVAIDAEALAGKQIVLRLTHSTSGSTDVTASFDIYEMDGTFVSTTAMDGVGHIFTDGNDYTRAQFVASEPSNDVSFREGTYGFLTLDQDGNWKYVLGSGKQATQALAAGEHATDIFQVQVTDSAGVSDTKTIEIDVTGINDAPIFDLNGALTAGNTVTVNYIENDAPTRIAPSVTLTDVDSGNFSGGSLRVAFTANGTADDQLTIKNGGLDGSEQNPVSLDGTNVLVGGNVIGTFSGGTNGADLVVTFTTDDATWGAIQILIAHIEYSNSSDAPSPLSRTVTFTVNDGDGTANNGTDTAVGTATVNVTPFNDPPAFTPASNEITYTENDPATPLIPALSVSDVDLPANFNGGQVTVGLSATIAGDELLLAGGTVVQSGSNIEVSGTVIGTVVAGGLLGGETNVTIALNAEATAASVSALLQALAFRSTSDDPNAGAEVWNRGATITFSDGGNIGGQISDNANATIQIVVQPVNDAPLMTAVNNSEHNDSSGATLSEGNAGLTATGTGTVIDPDSADTVTVTVGNPGSEVDEGGVRVFKIATPQPGHSAFEGVDYQTPGSGLQNQDLAVYGLTKAELFSYFTVHPTGDVNGTSYVHDGTPGTLTWAFDSDGQAFDFLASGETLVIYYPSIRPSDGHGGSTSGDGAIFVRIDGTNDAPQINVPVFGAATSFSAPSAIYASIADFNQDGPWDLAVSNHAAGTVSVLLGDNSTGRFGAPITTAVGTSPSYSAAYNLDNDLLADLVVVNQDSGTVSVLLSNGDGTFTAQASIQASHPDGLAFSDLDENGWVDLIIACTEGGGLLYAAGHGDGTFDTPIVLNSDYQFSEVLAADVNGDGDADLIAAAFDGQGPKVLVFIGNGQGGLSAPAVIDTGPGNIAASLAIGDLNADDHVDLAIANTGQTGIAVLFGDGQGGFGGLTTFGTVAPPNNRGAIVIDDFNSDGSADIAVANPDEDGISLFLGDGSGHFATEQVIATGDTAVAVAARDLNVDGTVDLVVSNLAAGTVSVLLQNAVQTQEEVPVTIQGISVSDVDAGSSQIKVTLAAGFGSVALESSNGLDSVVSNGDGSIDLFGSPGAINAALASGIVYTSEAEFSGNDTLTITVDDQDAGGAATSSRTLVISVAPVNDAPVLDLDPDQSSGASAGGFQTTFIIGGAGAPILDSDTSLVDPDNQVMHSMTVVLTPSVAGQFDYSHDSLQIDSAIEQVLASLGVEFVNSGTSASGMTFTFTGDLPWDPGSGIGYKQILESITFVSQANSTIGSTQDFSDRTVSVTINDGWADSNTAVTTLSVGARTDHWLGAASQFWHHSANDLDNWSLGMAPLPPDDVVIDQNTTVDHPSSADTIRSLTVESGAYLTVRAESSLYVGDILDNSGEILVRTAGTLEIGNDSVNIGIVTVEATGQIFINARLENDGDFNVLSGGYLEINGSLTNWGLVYADAGGYIYLDSVSGSGDYLIAGGAIEVGYGVGSDVTFDLASDTDDTLYLGDLADLQGRILGASHGDVIGLVGISNLEIVDYTPSVDDDSGVLHVTYDSGIDGYLTFVGAYQQSDFDTFDAGYGEFGAWEILFVNHEPVLGGTATGSVTEDVQPDVDNYLTTQGDLTVQDDDPGEAEYQAQTVEGSNGYGTFTLTADGHWTYAAFNGHQAIQQLNSNQALTDSFEAYSLDGSAHQTVTVTINGADDPQPPSVAVEATGNHVLSAAAGTDQKVDLTNLGISGDSAVTVEFWMNYSGAPISILFGFGLYDLLIGDFANGGFGIGFNTGSGDAYGVSRSDLIDQWHHVAAVFVGGSVTSSSIYIDGQLQTLHQIVGSPVDANAIIADDARIGGWTYDSQLSLEGKFDEVRIWHGARSATEIADSMNGVIAGTQPNLVAAYSFESVADGLGGVADDSGNGHHGTLHNLTAAANVVAEPTLVLDQSLDEDATLVFSSASPVAIAVADADSADLTLTLSVDHGTLSLATFSGLSGNNDSGSITVSGSIADINAALDGLTYQPDADYNGPDALVLSVHDADQLSDSRTIGIVVNAVNDAPTAHDDASAATFTEDTDTVIAASALLSNDTDPENDTLTIVSVGGTSQQGGTVTLDGTDITYHLAANYNGSDSFVYTVSDGSLTSSASVTFTVGDVNDAPVAADETLNGNIAGFTYFGSGTGANGHWYKGGGVGYYELWADAQAVADAAGGYLVTITSLYENEFVRDLIYPNDGIHANIDVAWLGASDAAEEGVWRWVVGPEAGQQFWQGGPSPGGDGVSLMYANWGAGEPNDSGAGEDFATIVTADSGIWNDNGSVTWDPDSKEYVIEVSIVEDVDSIIPSAFLLANDADAEGEALSINSVSETSAQGGTVTLLANGNVQYRSAQNYSGTDSFTYTVKDASNAVSSTATVTFTVAAAGEPATLGFGAATVTPTFTTLDADPTLSGTMAVGINDLGIVVGQGDLDASNQRGWLYDGSAFTVLSAFSAQDTNAHDINNSGIIVGDYSPVRSTPRYGFSYDGTYQQIVSASSGASTNANGINDSGVIVGSAYIQGGARYSGYIDNNGSFTYFNAPGTVNSLGDTFANGINNAGLIVGTFNTDASSQAGYKAFIYDGSSFTELVHPDAVLGTYAAGVNDSGLVVGWYDDAGNVPHGFIYSGGVFTTIDTPLGAFGTVINGINNVGQIVGYYYDSSHAAHGFVADVDGGLALPTSNGSSTLQFTGLSIADSDSDFFIMTARVGHGTLSANDTSSVSMVDSDGSDGTLSMTGTLVGVQQMLKAGFNYTAANANPDILTVTANDGTTSEILNFVFGNAPGATLTGTSNQDILIGGHGADTMTGNAGADTFVFAPGFSHDVIADFTPGVDSVAIDSSLFDTVADMLANHTTDVSGNAVITVDGSNTITFTGVTTYTLQQHQSDFHLIQSGFQLVA